MWWIAAAWGADRGAPAIVPIRVDEAPRIDGVLDEAVWQEEAISGFVEMQPVPGKADRGTRAWVAYDDRALYLAFDAKVDPSRAQSNAMSPRDRNRAEDTVGVLLDTFRDGRRAYLFMVNGRGVQGDGIYVDGETFLGFPDLSWDGVFSAAGRFDRGSYQVEMAIPLRSLRFPPGESQTWNVVLWQHLPVPTSDYTWPPVDPNAAGVLVQAATLGPFEVSARQSRIELLPTLTGLLDLSASPRPLVDPGLAARVGLTSSLLAEVTVNPDFSQIESDVGQVSANVKFPLFYPERRPFFLESADLFALPVTLVHTRSIVDPLAGYKLTGRAGPLGIGFVGGYDQRPAASTISVDYASGESLPSWDPALVEEADAIDHVLRLRGDLGGGDSLGVLLSDKELLTSEGSFSNRVLAADAQLTAGRYRVTGLLLGSTTTFPGQQRAALAPGWDGRLFRQGERWTFEVGHSHLSRAFRAENGFLTEVGRTRFDAGTSLLFRPGEVVRFLSPGVGGQIALDPRGDLVYGDTGAGVEANLGRRWSLAQQLIAIRERYLGTDFALWSYSGSVSVQPASAWYVGVDYRLGTLPHYAAQTPGQLYRGFDWSIVPATNFDAFGRLNVGAQVAVGVFGPEPFGPPEYVTAIPRLTALLSLTPRWQLRAIEQYDSASGTLQSSGLLGWVLNYGTVGYLGYTEAVPLSGEGAPVRTAFAKIGYLARL